MENVLLKFVEIVPLLFIIWLVLKLLNLTDKYCKNANEVELENIRNLQQQTMFDKHKEKEMKMLEIKNNHDLNILKEKRI